MALHKYWNRQRYDTNTRANYPQPPITGMKTPERSVEDTIIRSIHFPIMSTHVLTGPDDSPPIWGWWDSSTVMWASRWNTSLVVSPGINEWGDPDSLGSVRLSPTIILDQSIPAYDVIWHGPRDGVQFHGQRKGKLSNPINGVATAMWCTDTRNVFGNAGNFYTVSHRGTCMSSFLWGSELEH